SCSDALGRPYHPRGRCRGRARCRSKFAAARGAVRPDSARSLHAGRRWIYGCRTASGTSGHGKQIQRCEALGIAAYVMKPVSQRALKAAITAALSRVVPSSKETVREQASSTTRPSLRILLVEDNVVNQQLARRLFEKQGHAVRVAGDGRQALAAYDEEDFDLILMDVQMPEMGGYEATAELRRKEDLLHR